jgi:hypothetical protein
MAEKSRQPPQPLTALGRAAEYDAALASEALDEVKDARERYRRMYDDAKDVAGSTDATDALLRRARLDVELEDDDDLIATTPLLLARADLQTGDKAEALALQSTVFSHRSDPALAERDYKEARKLLDGIAEPAAENASAVPYAQGEILRMRSLSVKLQPVTNDVGVRLEQRCQYLQDAQRSYVEAMQPGDARWTIRAGIRIASMYVALHDELLAIPVPPSFSKTEDDKKLFRAAMRVRYRILLEKGIDLLEHVLQFDTRTQVKSGWLDRAKAIRGQLQQQLADEKAEIAKLPYTEKDIQEGLDRIAQRNKKKP